MTPFNAKIIDISVDDLRNSFLSDFDSIDEIRAQEAYIGMIGVVEDTLEPGSNGGPNAFVVRFDDGEQIIVMPHDIEPSDEDTTNVNDLPKASSEVFTRLDAGECELLDKLIVAMAPNGRDSNAIVNEAIDIVLARSRAMAREYRR